MAQRPGFTNYSVEQGLSQSQVYSITQDQYGYIWAATLAGVNSFDGHTFKVYDKSAGLASPLAYKVFVDRNNHLWMATQKGVQLFNGNGFINISLPKETGNAAVTNIKQDNKGNMYLLCGARLLKVAGNSAFIMDTAGLRAQVISIESDKKGVLYAITLKSEIYFRENNQWQLYAHVPVAVTSSQQLLVFFNHENKGIIVTRNSVYEKAGNALILKTAFGKGNRKVVCIEEDASGSLWIGTELGAYAIHPDYTTSHYRAGDGFTDNQIHDIQLDREGNLWFASDAEGIFRLGERTFTYIDKTSGLNSNVVMGIVREGKDMWIGTAESGLLKLENGDSPAKQVAVPANQPRKINSLFRDSRGRLWIGNFGGLWVRENQSYREIHTPKGNTFPTVIAFYEESDGTIWLATAAGVYHISDGRTPVKIQPLYDVCFSILETGKDTMLIGTSSGLQYITGKKKIRLVTVPALINTTVNCLFRYGKYILAGTSEDGIVFWDRANNTTFICNKKDGLASNFIFSMYQAQDGQLWVGTGSGIHSVMLQENTNRFFVKKYSVFNNAYGPECNLNSVAEDSNGRLWFGTVRGVVIYTPPLQNKKQPLH